MNPFENNYGLLFFPDSGDPDIIPIYSKTSPHDGEYLQYFSTFKRGTEWWSDEDTQRDWMLYPVGRQEVEPAEVEITMIDVPGSDIPIDLTESLVGRPIYKMRKAEWEFKMVQPRHLWDATYSEIMNILHGRKFLIVRMEDPAWFYRGRVTVKSTASDRANGRIKIHAQLEPFKYSVQSSEDDWLWDPFSFEDGIIWFNPNEYAEGWEFPESFGYFPVLPGSPITITLGAGVEAPTAPAFVAAGEDATLTWKGDDYELPVGTEVRIDGLEISARNKQTITLSTDGEDTAYVSVHFRRASF